MSPVNTELSGFTVRAGRGFSGSDSDAVLSSLTAVIGHSVFISHVFFYLYLYILFCTEFFFFLFLEGNTSLLSREMRSRTQMQRKIMVLIIK